ncbi:hypothetical protein Q7P37_006765 [Cladosporium fusiforme]
MEVRARPAMSISTLGRTCREACLAFQLTSTSSPPILLSLLITPVQWSVETPATSICLSSSYPRPINPPPPRQRPNPGVSNSLLAIATTHQRACLSVTTTTSPVPSTRQRAPPPCPSPHPDNLSPARHPSSVDLSSSLTAEPLDRTSHPHHLPPIDCCIHRTSYTPVRQHLELPDATPPERCFIHGLDLEPPFWTVSTCKQIRTASFALLVYICGMINRWQEQRAAYHVDTKSEARSKSFD